MISEDALTESLDKYQKHLTSLPIEFGGTYHLPETSFYLFGMGNRDHPALKNVLDEIPKWHASEVFLYLYDIN